MLPLTVPIYFSSTSQNLGLRSIYTINDTIKLTRKESIRAIAIQVITLHGDIPFFNCRVMQVLDCTCSSCFPSPSSPSSSLLSSSSSSFPSVSSQSSSVSSNFTLFQFYSFEELLSPLFLSEYTSQSESVSTSQMTSSSSEFIWKRGYSCFIPFLDEAINYLYLQCLFK